MKPNSIKSKAEKRLLLSTIYNRIIKMFTPGRFKVGDYVRIADYKGVFDKGYEPNFSTAIFTVTKVNLTNPVTYKVKHKDTEEKLLQSFYDSELVKVKNPDAFLIKKIIKRKKDKVYVSWLGFSNKYNSWINKSDLL